MTTTLKILVTLFFSAIILWFCFFNITPVPVALTPWLPAWEIPISLIFAAGLFLGFLWGGLIVWINDAFIRRGNRELRSKIRTLESQNFTQKSIVP